MTDYIFFAAAVTAAYFIKGLCGFANTLVLSAVMSFRIDNINISPVELILGLPSNLIMAWRGRKKIDLKLVLPITGLMVVGLIPGVFLLKNTNAGFIKIIFGAVIVLLGLEMLLRREKENGKKVPGWVLTGIGLLAGVLCGLYGIGALVAVYMGRTVTDTAKMKANMCAVFMLENIFRFIVYTVSGVLTAAVFKEAFSLLPFMLLGLFVGIKSCGKLNEFYVRRVVQVMLIVSGIALIVQNL
jgi:uncharacterized membrane protein YfcA